MKNHRDPWVTGKYQLSRRKFLKQGLVYVPALFFISKGLKGQTTTGTNSDLNSVISGATSGDLIEFPASGGPFTYTTDVTQPSNKWLRIYLNGRTVNLNGCKWRLNAHATGVHECYGGRVNRAYTSDPNNGAFVINDERGSAAIRVHHMTFGASGLNGDETYMSIQGRGPGLLDNCAFVDMEGAQEFIHVDGWNAGDATGWNNDAGSALAGSANIFYFEFNTCTNSASQSNVAWIQSYKGARICYRYNVFDHVNVDVHGTPDEVGGRWWEFYYNLWQNTVGGIGSSPCMNIRGGSGVCHNNTATGSGYTKQIQMCEEDNDAYPALYQVGRGLSQALDPAYIWDNTGITAVPDACDAPEIIGMVQLNRDYYESARPGYTAYTYPHPLRGESGGAASVRMRGTGRLLGTGKVR